MREVSVSTFAFQKDYGDFKALDMAKEIGADGVDFSLDGKTWDFRNPQSVFSCGDRAVTEYANSLRAYAEKIGIKIFQTHGRLEGFKNIKEEDDALVENIRLDCLATKALGALVCVVHTATTIFLGADAKPELMRALNDQMFARILPFADKYGVYIATETFGDATGKNCIDFFGNAEEFVNAYRRVRKGDPFGKYLRVCIDTGHSNKATRFAQPKSGDVIRMVGKDAIACLHLNDNDTFTDQHKTPFTGSIDWDDVFCALDEVGYSGAYNMEINPVHFGRDFMAEEDRFAVGVMRHYLSKRYEN